MTSSAMNMTSPESKSPAPIAAGQSLAADVNENTSNKSPRLLSPAQVESGLPIIVTSMPFSPVSSQASMVNFAHGLNLTISNGIINLKNRNGGESTLLVAPATSNLSACTQSNVSSAKPITVVTGTIPVMSGPITSIGVPTSPPGLMIGSQTASQLKVPNPNTIQIRPQQVIMSQGNNLTNNSIAMAMASRLSLPFQASPTLSATSISGLRALAPGSASTTTTILSPQFQAMQPIRGTPVSLAGVSQPQVQPVAAQPMAIRSAFPVLINRPVTFAGRPQLLTAQPSRLAPRQFGTQVAVQVAGQTTVARGTIMPIFRPATAVKHISMATTNATLVSHNQAQAAQQQLLNQMVSSASMQGMAHISFRPGIPVSKVMERPQNIADARLLNSIPVSRFLCPQSTGPIAITSPLMSPLITCEQPLPAVSQGAANGSAIFMSGSLQASSVASSTPEKKKVEHFLGEKKIDHFLGDPPFRTPTTSPLPSLCQDLITVSAPLVLPQAPVAKSLMKEGIKSTEEKKEERREDAEVGFDALKAMDWSSEGIATLPGSNLKLKLNEFGMVEMVSEDIPATLVKTVDSGVGVNTTDFNMKTSTLVDKDSEGCQGLTPSAPTPIKEPVKKCENCGKYGFLKDFCKTGRFCSQACVGAYAGRKNKHSPGANSLLSHKPIFHLKKKPKKTIGQSNPARVPVTSPPPTTEGETPNDKEQLASVPSGHDRKFKHFDWVSYLEEQKAVSAPSKLFKDPFPSQKNIFKPGMRLEGIDPKHQNLFCVLSVSEVQGYRLRLHFDGYSECYDFWCNADSPFIFPVGWCEKNNKPLQSPKHMLPLNFNWASYLKTTKYIAAPKTAFFNQPFLMVTPNAFRVGMKLEAVDRKNTALICVATVADVLGDKILIHFDGWDDLYDYWCDITSPFIHPVGWCQDNGHTLSPPCDWPEEEIENFTWDEYLAQTQSQGVPARAFKPRVPVLFEPGMKIEAIDKRNPIQVRVATIKEVKDHQVLIHFDGWDDVYDYWVDDDSPDIKPPGWCARTCNSNLQPPPVESESNGEGNCPTPCCNGVGHVKGAKYTGHHSSFGCPYAIQNMNKESTLMDRLGSTRAEEGTAASLAARIKSECGEVRRAYALRSDQQESRCPHAGCDSSGHITGKFTSHHRLSGCPLYEKNILRMNAELQSKPPIKPGRGRKRKIFSTSEVDSKEGILTESSLPKVPRERTDNSFLQNVHQSVFMSNTPDMPVQEGPAFWEYQAKLLPGVVEYLGEEVKKWGCEHVARFVGSLPGCQVFEKTFRDQEMDGESFLMLSQADIVNVMNIKLGPALKIYNSILLFKQTADS